MSRGAWVPRSVVRPSAAFDRGPVVLRPRVDRRESASGLGSHVPWRGVASWAGRSASSGLSGILSCRPRGDLVSTPRGTQTRRAPDSARRVFVRRMIRPASKGCQTSDARARENGRRSALDQRTGYPQTSGYVHTGWPIRPRRTPCTDTPPGYSRIALQRRTSRCYPLRTFGAGNAGGALRGTLRNPRTNA